jgi:hypothetical protein
MHVGKTKKLWECLKQSWRWRPKIETEPGLLAVEHGVLTLLPKSHRNALQQSSIAFTVTDFDHTFTVISHISTLLVWTLESRSGPVRSSDLLLIWFTISFLNSFPVHLTLSQPIPLFGNPCYRLLGYLCISFAYWSAQPFHFRFHSIMIHCYSSYYFTCCIHSLGRLIIYILVFCYSI